MAIAMTGHIRGRPAANVVASSAPDPDEFGCVRIAVVGTVRRCRGMRVDG